MPSYYDVYVLARDRSEPVATRFLDAFVPDRDPVASEYEFPQYSPEPVVTFATAVEAIRYCVARPAEPQSFYFGNRGSEPAWAMLFFTCDGGLILGLSVAEGEQEALAALKEHAGSGVGYIDFESPPPDTVTEFERLATGTPR